MRFSILLLVVAVWGIWPAVALAKPKVAVAPFDGDVNGKIAAVVSDAAAANAKLTSAKAVAKAIKELSISEPDNVRAAKQLRKRLDVDAVIYGKLERDGAKNKLTIRVYTRGKDPARFAIEYKSASSKVFRERLRDELANRLAPEENGKDDDDEPASTVARSEEPASKRPGNDVPASKRPSSDDPASKRPGNDMQARTAARDDDGADVHVRKHVRNPKPVEAVRDGVSQSAVFVDLGPGGVHRTLTYAANAGQTPPPPVGTGALAYQLDGEIYPGAFDSLTGTAAALGGYATLNKAALLSISIPGTAKIAPISETSFAIGVRYRFIFGESSIAVGLGYWGQSFIADRSALASPSQLNMPDTSYQAVAPDALLRLAVLPTVALTLQVDLPLMLSSGPITDPSGFGAASVLSFAVQAGADVALGPHYGLHFAGFFDQESLSFKAGMLSSATDRTMGASAALAFWY